MNKLYTFFLPQLSTWLSVKTEAGLHFIFFASFVSHKVLIFFCLKNSLSKLFGD